MVAVVLPVVFQVIGGRLGLPMALLISGSLAGSLLANQFGFDGSAYAANLLAGVPGRVEVAARMAAVAGMTLPPLVAVAVVLGVLSGDGRLVPALGVGAVAYGTSSALAMIVSVLVPYALPESTNPFALSTGTGGLRGFVSFGPVILGGALASPLTVAALPAALTLGLGLLIGGALLAAGVLIAGNVLDQRGPEVLQAVTPRR
jgi:ABC-2 type transport system permease protein